LRPACCYWCPILVQSQLEVPMTTTQVRWTQLLTDAVNIPGSMLEAYRAFHNYSVGNQILAFTQCHKRGIPVGPIATFQGWKKKGRHVTRGSQAIELCMPVTFKTKPENADEPERVRQVFLFRRNWFVLSQTEGAELEAPTIPGWDRETALKALNVEVVPFDATDGNMQGYAFGHSIAINPVAQIPEKTTFHELAHVVLGHTENGAMNDGATLVRSLKEAEAESVALLCLESLDLPGADYCRGYIQNWLRGAEIPEQSARRIFKAADTILKAGRDL
jgi:hypothetical protein